MFYRPSDPPPQDSLSFTVSTSFVWATSTARREADYPLRRLFLGDSFYAGGRVYIDGYTGRGKSMFCLGLGQSMATGMSFCMWPAGERSRVLYLDYEMGHEEIHGRMKFFAAKGLIVVCFDDPELGDDGLQPIDTKEGMNQVDELLRRSGASTVIVDNLYAACAGSLLGGGDKEGGWQAHSRLVPWVREMSKRGVQTVCVQHSNENGAPYGDKRIARQMYLHLHLERNMDALEDELRLKVETKKRRGGGIPKPFECTWTAGTGWRDNGPSKRDNSDLAKAFKDALAEVPETVVPGQKARLKEVEAVRRAFYTRLGNMKQDTKKKAFQHHREYAVRDGLIREHGGGWFEVLV